MSFMNEMLFNNLVQLDGPGPDIKLSIDNVPQVPGIDYIAIPRRRIVYVKNLPPAGTWVTYVSDIDDYVAFMRPDGIPI